MYIFCLLELEKLQIKIKEVTELQLNKQRSRHFYPTEEPSFYCVYFKVQPDLGILVVLVEYQSRVSFIFQNELKSNTWSVGNEQIVLNIQM